MIIEAMAATIAGFAAEALKTLWVWSETNHRPNQWTIEAALNAFRLAPYRYTIEHVTRAKVNSLYRSETVNKAVNGSETSRHMRGLACDYEPNGMTLDQLANTIIELVKAKKLGDVEEVIKETSKGIVHVGWFDAHETQKQTEFLEEIAPKKYKPLGA